MGSNPYSVYTGGSSSASKPSSGGHSHGGLLGDILGKAAGLATHLGTDIKDAAFGLPVGAVNMVEHPVKSIEQMGKATWHDWSPLIHGHPGEFAHQTYEHPLAPLLDLATVFSAGAGAAAKLGKIGEMAGMDGALVKGAADLGKAKKVSITDQSRILKGETPRPALPKTYNASAGANLRRAMTDRALKNLEAHGRVPKAFTAAQREGRLYNRLHYIDLAHRHAAMNYTINRLMTAGTLASDKFASIVHPHVLSQNYWQMRKFAHAIPVGSEVPAGYIPIKEMTSPAMFNPIEGQSLETRLRNFSNPKTEGSFVTNSTKDAAKVNGGKDMLVVPHHTLKSLGIEGADSTKALRKFAHSPVTWWKRIQVGYAPRVVVNNVMGNWVMHAMRTMGTHGSARSIVDASRFIKGERGAMADFKAMHGDILKNQGEEAAAKFTVLAHPHMIDAPNVTAIEKTFGKRAADAVRKNPDWINKHFKTELGSTFGNVLQDGPKTREGKFLKQGFYPVVHQLADKPVRIAALYHFMRNAPEVKGFLSTHPGVSLDEAISKVLDKNPNGLRARAEAHVRSIAGDYSTMSPRERVLQNAVPFYLWDKHIVKHVSNMLNERPGVLNAAAKVGTQGTKEGQQILGALPEFMQGALPLSLFGAKQHGDRTPLLMTTGLNPFHTVGDIAQALTAATTRHGGSAGADAAGNLSPLITGIIEQISGHKIGTNAPVDTHGGIIPSVLANTLGSTTYGTLAKQIIQGTPKPKSGKPFLYSKSPATTATGLFGLPVRNASLARAHQMAAQESGTKSPRRRGRTGRSMRA